MKLLKNEKFFLFFLSILLIFKVIQNSLRLNAIHNFK